MRSVLAVALVFVAVRAGAVCTDPGTAIAAARAQIDTDCDCAGALTHGTYVHCAAGVLKQRVAAHTLSPSCMADVRRCASRSTCGRPGRVACCISHGGAPARCTIRKPSSCTEGCAASATSCCDACSGTGCAPPSTTSTTSTTIPSFCGNGIIDPGEMCDGESFCTSTCGIPLEACCALPGSDMCTVGCTPIGMSCLFACGSNNPTAHVGQHPVWTAACPGAPPDAHVGQGTCESTPIAPTSVCCPLAAGGCTTTPATDTEELALAAFDCLVSQRVTSSVIRQCIGGTCAPAH